MSRDPWGHFKDPNTHVANPSPSVHLLPDPFPTEAAHCGAECSGLYSAGPGCKFTVNSNLYDLGKWVPPRGNCFPICKMAQNFFAHARAHPVAPHTHNKLLFVLKNSNSFAPSSNLGSPSPYPSIKSSSDPIGVGASVSTFVLLDWGIFGEQARD